MQGENDMPSERSEAQTLALLDAERQLLVAIWEHTHARALIAECNVASGRNNRVTRWVILSLIAVGVLYTMAILFLASFSLYTTTSIVALVLAALLISDLLKRQATIASFKDKAVYSERLALVKIEALVPGNVVSLHDGFDIDERLTCESIRQKAAFRRLRSALVSEITTAPERAR